eukprot:TRINITY_DN9409_c0_g1_i1.p1 TRINITY_DN9409_c0_g1~~TRINITY_DN9409_c0_g1_i1.p1  ORF type:complete len:798 (-),score=236.35 TRINITY_DN9409_c0_g1_i1:257-2650(-)
MAAVTFAAVPSLQSADSFEDGDDSSAASDGEELEYLPVMSTKSSRRREAVSAESRRFSAEGYEPPVYPKSDEEKKLLYDLFRTSHDSKLHMLFSNVPKETLGQIVDAMFFKKIPSGENAIMQGAEGDYFYMVRSGSFDIFVQEEQQEGKKVFEAGPGFVFGELALLYNAQRTATITATEASEVWCLDREAFQHLVVGSFRHMFQQYVQFINAVDIFKELNEEQKAALAEVMHEEAFENDEVILEQGERDDKMFILREGKAVACIQGDQGEVEVMHYSEGDYFGEIALLFGEPRKASVYAVGACSCMYVSRATFNRILGPLQDLLKQNLERYSKYQDAIAKANEDEAKLEQGAEDLPVVHRKRQRKLTEVPLKGTMKHPDDSVKPTPRDEDQPLDLPTASSSSTASAPGDDAKKPTTLAEKVELDFENPHLVAPCEKFWSTTSHATVYGGVVRGQKFTDNKAIVSCGKARLASADDEDACAWQAPSRLKSTTDIAVVCQKGQKIPSDPTPNQDNYFVHHVGNVTMYGACDGHGPFGHLVSFRIVQSLPRLIEGSQHFGKDWPAAFREAFQAAEEELEAFALEHSVNIEASGAAGSVLVLEEQTVHIAHIGDARIMLGSWNRRDSHLIHGTRDHKPSLPEEKARLEAAGMEVREVDADNWRIFLPGKTFPGLTMSRCFGDTICKGVSREPEYSKFLMQPTDEWYAIIASDGIWEFIEAEECCTLTSKKLRLKGPRETAHFLTRTSRKRWHHICGDYCDDITCIVVQWNSNRKEEGFNHALTVKREGSVDAPAAAQAADS